MPNPSTYQPPYGPYQATYPYGQVPFDYQITNGAPYAASPIYPFRFVTIVGSNLVRQSVSEDWPIAISQPNTAAWNTPYAANAGFQVQTFNAGQDCWLMLGANVAAGSYLRSDDEGRGVTATGRYELISALAYEAGTTGNLIRVKVLRLTQQYNCGFSEFSNEFDFEFGVPCPWPPVQ